MAARTSSLVGMSWALGNTSIFRLPPLNCATFSAEVVGGAVWPAVSGASCENFSTTGSARGGQAGNAGSVRTPARRRKGFFQYFIVSLGMVCGLVAR